MSFELVRIGWPNIVAIAALAVMPIVSLAALPQRSEAAAPIASTATICPAPDTAMTYTALLTSATPE